MNMRALALIPIFALTAACGASTVQAPTETTDIQTGTVESVTLGSGLDCDVFDTTKAGGVDCNWAAFTPLASWEDRIGTLEIVAVENATVELSRYADGHLCVTVDGMQSGGITCSYPAR